VVSGFSIDVNIRFDYHFSNFFRVLVSRHLTEETGPSSAKFLHLGSKLVTPLVCGEHKNIFQSIEKRTRLYR